MSKISQYANSVAALGTDDLFDVSEKISSSPDVYESRKMTGAVLATFIQSYTSNILNTNSLTLGGNYTHDFAGNQLVFNNGNLGVVGEIGVTAFNAGQVNVFVAGDELGQSILAVKNAGNVGVGTLTPDASAVLDASSTDSGFLVPRMTTAQKTAISTPAESLIVYDTDLNGFQYYNSAGSWAAFDSNFANTDLTVGAGREHTLTDTVRIKGGTFQVEGLNTLGTASAFELYDGDTTPALNWQFRNNGDVYLGKSEQVFYGADTSNSSVLGFSVVGAGHNTVKLGSGAFRTPSGNRLSLQVLGYQGASSTVSNEFSSYDWLFENGGSAGLAIAANSSQTSQLAFFSGSSENVFQQIGNDFYFYRRNPNAGYWLTHFGSSRVTVLGKTGTDSVVVDTNVGLIFKNDTQLFIDNSTAGSTTNVSPDLRFRTTYWNGSASVRGEMKIGTSTDTSGNYKMEFKNDGGTVALKINGADALPQLPEFTVAGVPAADADNKSGFVCITDEAGGYVTAFSDGTNWRRTTDRAIIS